MSVPRCDRGQGRSPPSHRRPKKPVEKRMGEPNGLLPTNGDPNRKERRQSPRPPPWREADGRDCIENFGGYIIQILEHTSIHKDVILVGRAARLVSGSDRLPRRVPTGMSYHSRLESHRDPSVPFIAPTALYGGRTVCLSFTAVTWRRPTQPIALNLLVWNIERREQDRVVR